MKNHTTSLELSKKMRELGFPQKSEFYWKEVIDDHSTLPEIINFKYKEGEGFYDYPNGVDKWEEKSHSAYLASELGEWLPVFIEGWLMEIHKEGNGIWMVGDSSGSIERGFEDKNLPNAMAKMLIHLAEQGIINLKEL